MIFRKINFKIVHILNAQSSTKQIQIYKINKKMIYPNFHWIFKINLTNLKINNKVALSGKQNLHSKVLIKMIINNNQIRMKRYFIPRICPSKLIKQFQYQKANNYLNIKMKKIKMTNFNFLHPYKIKGKVQTLQHFFRNFFKILFRNSALVLKHPLLKNEFQLFLYF